MGESDRTGTTKRGLLDALPCIIEGVVAPLIVGIIIVFFFFGPTVTALAIVVLLVLGGLLGGCAVVARKRPESRIARTGLVVLLVLGLIIVVAAIVVYLGFMFVQMLGDFLVNPLLTLAAVALIAGICVVSYVADRWWKRRKRRVSPAAEKGKPEEPAPKPPAAERAERKTCPICGAPMQRKERFCRNCGATVEETR